MLKDIKIIPARLSDREQTQLKPDAGELMEYINGRYIERVHETGAEFRRRLIDVLERVPDEYLGRAVQLVITTLPRYAYIGNISADATPDPGKVLRIDMLSATYETRELPESCTIKPDKTHLCAK